MTRHTYICLCLALVAPAIPLRAANGPHAGTDTQKVRVWTDDDIEKLHDLVPISIVGPTDEDTSVAEPAPTPSDITENPAWYAAQAARLREELQYRQAQLRDYRQSLDDARSLKGTTGGIDLVGEDFAITPEAGIEILQQRVSEEQTKLNDLEDLARRNDIEPGTLRGE
jgi:hypothetical protein